MAEHGREPSPPLKPLILVDNPTVEGLETYAAEGQPSFGLFTAAGGRMIGGHLVNDDNRMKAGATLNLFWDGGPMPCIRSNHATKLPGRRLLMHVMVQPEIAIRLLTDVTLSSLGTLARCLVVATTSTTGTRFWRDVPPFVGPALCTHSDALTALLCREPPKGNEPNELRPRALPLSQEAACLWIMFHDEVERNIGPDGPWAPIRGLAAKLPEHAARVAGVLSVAAKPDTDSIEKSALEGSIMLAGHYAAEALRLVDAGMIDPGLVLAEKLLAWLHVDAGRGATHLAEIYQFGPAGIRTKTTAARIVGFLEDHGWLYRLKPGVELGGRRRREAWAVVR